MQTKEKSPCKNIQKKTKYILLVMNNVSLVRSWSQKQIKREQNAISKSAVSKWATEGKIFKIKKTFKVQLKSVFPLYFFFHNFPSHSKVLKPTYTQGMNHDSCYFVLEFDLPGSHSCFHGDQAGFHDSHIRYCNHAVVDLGRENVEDDWFDNSDDSENYNLQDFVGLYWNPVNFLAICSENTLGCSEHWYHKMKLNENKHCVLESCWLDMLAG